MSNLLKNLVKEDWWSDLSSAEQAAYIKGKLVVLKIQID
jgi:hypothetical protein